MGPREQTEYRFCPERGGRYAGNTSRILYENRGICPAQAVGFRSQRSRYSRSDQLWQQAESLVALRAWAHMVRNANRPYQRWIRLPILRRYPPCPRSNRPGFPISRPGSSVAPSKKPTFTANRGPSRQPPESMVALSKGP